MMVSTLKWEWKVEPVSPPTLYEDTVTQCDDSSTASSLTAFELQSSIVKDEDENTIVSNSENKAEVFSKLLEEIEDLDHFEELLNEENFSNWLEEKAELPIFEDIPIEPARCYSVQNFKSEDLKPVAQQQYVITPQQHITQDTNTLLQEFETVFDAVEMTHGTLTPPQSPPSVDNKRVVTTLVPIPVIFTEPIVQPLYYQERINVPLSSLDLQPGTPQPDVAHELAVVDELVRSRAENMVVDDDGWEEEKKQESIASPSSPSSSSCSTFSEYSSDPEWIPETVQSSSSSIYVDKPTKGRSKRSGKPYLRIGPEDKKSRKKEQNKNAATRYRQKKKAEIEEILSEEKGLLDHHDELDTKVTDLKREIKYLKGLMRDLFKAKGLIQ